MSGVAWQAYNPLSGVAPQVYDPISGVARRKFITRCPVLHARRRCILCLVCNIALETEHLICYIPWWWWYVEFVNLGLLYICVHMMVNFSRKFRWCLIMLYNTRFSHWNFVPVIIHASLSLYLNELTIQKERRQVSVTIER